MAFKKYNDLILGIIILAFGLIYFLLTQQVPERNVGLVTARFVPNLLSIAMFILGSLQLIAGFSKIKKFTEGPVEGDEEKVDYSTVVKTLVSIVLYIALIDIVGFLIITAVFLFTQFIVLTPVDKKKNYVQYAVIAVATSVVIYLVFRNGLDLMLPAGILS
jgi:putative tricarboxylic transport membrane protein